MPKLNGTVAHTFLNKHICEKLHQFLSSIKRDARKRKLVPFFCLTVYPVASDAQHRCGLLLQTEASGLRVRLSVCVFVCWADRETQQNVRIDRDVDWIVDSGGPNEPSRIR